LPNALITKTVPEWNESRWAHNTLHINVLRDGLLRGPTPAVSKENNVPQDMPLFSGFLRRYREPAGAKSY
jgi:hypothetical protein